MAIDTDLDIPPYFDDFDQLKDFYLILHNSGVALQARELTQAQRMLLDKIEKLGRFSLTEGSVIEGCDFGYDQNLKFVRLRDTTVLDGSDVTRGAGLDMTKHKPTPAEGGASNGQILYGEVSGAVAEIVDVVGGYETNLDSSSPETNPTNTVFFKYIGKRPGYDRTHSPEFAPNENLMIVDRKAAIKGVALAKDPATDTVVEGGSGYTTGNRIAYGDALVNITATKDEGGVNGIVEGVSITDTTTMHDVAGLLISQPKEEQAGAWVEADPQPSIKAKITFFFDGATRVTSVNDSTRVTGSSYQFSVDDGLIWQKGTPLRVQSQSIVVQKYDNRPDDVAVVFDVEENIVTWHTDSSLLDNADGFNNENAPGADRLRLRPKLATVRNLSTSTLPATYTKLVEFRDGKPVRVNQTARLGPLGELMARRSDEVHGDYVINPFTVVSQTDDSVIENGYGELGLAVSSGLAYVKGYRQEFHNTTRVLLDRGYDNTSNSASQSIGVDIGHFTRVNGVRGHPVGNAKDGIVWYVQDDDPENPTAINIGSAAAPDGNGRPVVANAKVVGKSYVRGFQHYDASDFNLYVFSSEGDDFVDFPPDQATRAISYDTSNNYSFAGTLVRVPASYVKENPPMVPYREFGGGRVSVFDLGHDAIKELASVKCTVPGRKSVSDVSGNGVVVISGLEDDGWDEDVNGVVLTVGNDIYHDDMSGVVVSNASANVCHVDTGNASISGAGVFHFNSRAMVSSARSKTSNSATETIGLTANEDVYFLAHADGFELTSVTNVGGDDITSDFVMDGGQRDESYTNASVRHTGSTVGNVIVTYKYYEHDSIAGDVLPVFYRNSYPSTGVEDIPVYETVSGVQYDLRDCVDFRVNLANAGVELAKHVVPGTNFVFDVQQHLGRVDLLELTRRGDISIVEGEPSLTPAPPNPSSDAMVISSVSVPPFPALDSVTAQEAKRPDMAVRLNDKQRKRITQAELNGMRERLRSLEYYTTLTVLEKDTSDLVIRSEIDPSLNRFKHGIYVDNFENLSIGNFRDSEFKASIDPARKLLQPTFRSYDVKMDRDGGSGGSEYGDLIALSPVTPEDEIVVSQEQATTSRVCAGSVYNYRGDVFLTPEYDNGPDVTAGPVKTIDIDVDTASPALAVLDQINDILADQVVDESVVETHEQKISRETESKGSVLVRKVHTDITTTTTTTKRHQQLVGRSDTRTNTEKVGDFVTDVSFKRYIRAQPIEFTATGLMPNVRHWIFFDGEDMTFECRRQTGTGATDFDGDMVSDVDGVLRGVFNLPPGRFYVGDRNFVVLSEPSLDNRIEALSAAAGRFSAYNFSANRSALDLNLNTRSLNVDTKEIVNSETMKTYRRLTAVSRQNINLSLTPRRFGIIVCNWNRIVGATSYDLYISNAGGGTPSNVVATGISPTTTTYTITGLANGARYVVRIVANVP